MIPVRLTLRNFMCYRDAAEVLDLTGVHLACLSGENGAGKSALLEAITWVLWGRARDRAMDDELISKGASEMEVDYEFILNEQRYRVIRKRARKGNSGTTLLDLQVCSDGESDAWRILSGATVRETQVQINNLLKVDYETFTNSAFIMQGRADEFTVKNPAERKKVLADILGLEQYDRLEEQAKEEARQRKSRLNELEHDIARIDSELKDRPQHAEELERVEAALIEAQEKLAEIRGEITHVQARQQALEHSKQRIEELKSRIAKRENSIAEVQARIGRRSARKVELEELLSRSDEIKRGYNDWRSAYEEDGRLSESKGRLLELEKERVQIDWDIDKERLQLDGQRIRHEQDIAKLGRNLAGRGVVESQLSETLDKLRKLEQVQKQHEDTKCLREGLEVKLRQLNSEINTCEEEGKQIRQKLDMIVEAHAETNGHADCPLCGTALTGDALERVRRSYETDIAGKRREYEQKRKELDEVNRQIVATESRISKEKEQLKPMDMHRQREAQLKQAISRLDEDEKALAQDEAHLVGVNIRLQEADYAHETRSKKREIESRIKEIDYDEGAHNATRTRVAFLREKRYEELYHKLDGADRELQSVAADLEEATRNVDNARQEQEQDRAEVALLQPQLDELDNVSRELAAKQQAEAALSRQTSELGEMRGGLRDKLARCDAMQEEKSRHMAEYNAASDEKSIYDELTTAFGKKGIQAMIIENIVPEMEDETNALLGRMTDGRMSIQFATQRDAKSSKNVIETLDINISDEMGLRSYEMYSGGEAFRVNFAVRIALSKLLARRAGTRLQTLVIDEGFGSQDVQGREKLVSAIRSIQDDFEKILVITHIEELREEFPIRIDIIKTGSGSRIVMSGNEM